jgi:hypothetical protein
MWPAAHNRDDECFSIGSYGSGLVLKSLWTPLGICSGNVACRGPL